MTAREGRIVGTGLPRLLTEAEKEFLTEHIEPDFDNGVLVWKKARNKYTKYLVGRQVAGACNHNGYKVFGIKRPDTGKDQTYLVHRIMYWFHTGEEPDVLDHINRDKVDNRIVNLRAATTQQNIANAVRKCNKRTGYPGITKWDGVFKAQISHNGKKIYLGLYNTAEEAHEAYKQKHVEFHGEYSPYFNTEIRDVVALPNRERHKKPMQEVDTNNQGLVDTLLFRFEIIDGVVCYNPYCRNGGMELTTEKGKILAYVVDGERIPITKEAIVRFILSQGEQG